MRTQQQGLHQAHQLSGQPVCKWRTGLPSVLASVACASIQLVAKGSCVSCTAAQHLHGSLLIVALSASASSRLETS